MFTNIQLVEFCESLLGQPYWYGTYVNPCTESKLTSKAKQYPSHYGAGRMSTYRKHIAQGMLCTDCVGMIKGFFWTNGGQGVTDFIKNGKAYTNKYKSNGCPDTSANGLLTYCKEQGAKWGKINTIPDVPGILVFFDGHVGVYIGNGYVIEARGFKYGVVKTKLSARPWKHWAYLPTFLLMYGTNTLPKEEKPIQGHSVASVKAWQDAAIADGYKFPKYGADGEWGTECETVARKAIVKKRDSYTNRNLTKIVQAAVGVEVDGKCGKDTDAAIKTYQKKNGLTADGAVGLNTWKKILNI